MLGADALKYANVIKNTRVDIMQVKEVFKRYKISASLLVMVLTSWSSYCLAATNLGELANELSTPVDLFTSIIVKICYVIGFVLIVGSGLQYKRYRENPSEVRFSQPVLLFIFGVVVIILPLIPQWLSARTPNIPYSIRQ